MSVKRGVGVVVHLFFKECCFGIRFRVDSILNIGVFASFKGRGLTTACNFLDGVTVFPFFPVTTVLGLDRLCSQK